MGLLALAWYGYISIVAAALVALGYLTQWGREAIELGRRRRRSHRQKSVEERPQKPTADQIRVLNAVYVYFLEHGKPAPFRQLDKELDREDVPLRANVESMPRGLLIPDVAHRGGFFYAEDELFVTVDGLRFCEGGVTALNLLAHVLAYMATREKAFMPTATKPNLAVRDYEVQQALKLSPHELEQARLLVDSYEPLVRTSATRAQTGEWSFTLDLERIRRFRGVRNSEDYLVARTDQQ